MRKGRRRNKGKFVVVCYNEDTRCILCVFFKFKKQNQLSYLGVGLRSVSPPLKISYFYIAFCILIFVSI